MNKKIDNCDKKANNRSSDYQGYCSVSLGDNYDSITQKTKDLISDCGGVLDVHSVKFGHNRAKFKEEGARDDFNDKYEEMMKQDATNKKNDKKSTLGKAKTQKEIDKENKKKGLNENMKKVIRLTEGDLHRIIENSVKRILKEADDDDWQEHQEEWRPYYDRQRRLQNQKQAMKNCGGSQDYWSSGPNYPKYGDRGGRRTPEQARQMGYGNIQENINEIGNSPKYQKLLRRLADRKQNNGDWQSADDIHDYALNRREEQWNKFDACQNDKKKKSEYKKFRDMQKSYGA